MREKREKREKRERESVCVCVCVCARVGEIRASVILIFDKSTKFHF